MGALSFFIPQEKQFFDMFEKQSANVLKGAVALEEMLKNFKNLEKKKSRIEDIESDGDRMVHDILKELNQTFITPIDREDITALVSSLDDVLDYVEAVAVRLVLYEFKTPPKYMIEFASTLRCAVNDVHSGICLLRNFKQAQKIRDLCRDVNTHENEGDDLLHKAMAELFRGKDAIYIIKTKELYDNMETAIDKCEDVADVMGDILVKYA